MSSIPGYSLEAYLMWRYRVTVDGDGSSNWSLMAAEALGTVARRPDLTAAQFAIIVALFEPHREHIENLLCDFDEETQSWRDYGSSAFNAVPDEIYERAAVMIAGIVISSAARAPK